MTEVDRTATAIEDGPSGRALVVHQLVVASAPGKIASRTRVLDRRPLVIGRDPDAGLPVPDTEASRRHAEIVFDDARDAWEIRDLDSRNGMFVDGVATARADLVDGTVIRIGSSLLVHVVVTLASDRALVSEDEHLRGPSVRMQLVRGELALVAPRPVPVLLRGESGVGKERAARSIHAQSRRSGPLVAVNCAAIAPQVADSELFGHVSGAFTGATTRRDGLFAAADGGTLFLDEVGELPLELQPKLLRALATGEVRAVGATESKVVDVRVVAATLVDLDAEVKAGRFRGDLYARLAGWTVELPPLRARRDDLPTLVEALLPAGRRLTAGAMESLLIHGWPYNVRELEHALAVASARAGSSAVRAHHLPIGIGDVVRTRPRRGADAATPLPAPVPEVPIALAVDRDAPTPRQDDLLTVLRYYRGSVALTAGFFRRDRRQVYRWLDAHGIDLKTERGQG